MHGKLPEKVVNCLNIGSISVPDKNIVRHCKPETRFFTMKKMRSANLDKKNTALHSQVVTKWSEYDLKQRLGPYYG